MHRLAPPACTREQVEWAEARFLETQTTVLAFLLSVGFAAENIRCLSPLCVDAGFPCECSCRFVPVSGLSGGNLVTRAAEPAAAWYTGPTFLQLIGTALRTLAVLCHAFHPYATPCG